MTPSDLTTQTLVPPASDITLAEKHARVRAEIWVLDGLPGAAVRLTLTCRPPEYQTKGERTEAATFFIYSAALQLDTEVQSRHDDYVGQPILKRTAARVQRIARRLDKFVTPERVQMHDDINCGCWEYKKSLIAQGVGAAQLTELLAKRPCKFFWHTAPEYPGPGYFPDFPYMAKEFVERAFYRHTSFPDEWRERLGELCA